MSQLKVQPGRLKADLELYAHWGDAIYWDDPGAFERGIGLNQQFGVHGCKTPFPRVGQTLVAEFKRSWMLFRFVKVWHPASRDPVDMFFGTVEIIDQEMKSQGGGL